ncbi:MAG: hypothetical protein Q4B58_00055 [Bacteroidales bacterium]|nr:hypothetical protein [Bacteroidales bacterium]
MKKIALVLAAVAALAMTACGGKKAAQNESAEAPQSQESFQEQQIKMGMKVHLDSLTNAWLRIEKPMAVTYNAQEGKVKLSDAQKKVLPDYLVNPDEVMGSLESLSLKYRAMVVFDMDKEVAKLYGMNDVYTPAINKLAAEVDDPAVKYLYNVDEKVTYQERMNKVYSLEEENGRANYFWEAAATSIIEQLYILGRNQEVFLASFTDQDAEDITFYVSLLVDAYADLAEYNSELARLYNVILPLQVLNAITVDELRTQLNQIDADIANARKALFM